MLVAVVMAACKNAAEEQEAPARPDSYCIGLYIESGEKAVSRATPAGDYEPGEGYENYIDVTGGDFRVALFTADKADPTADGVLIGQPTDIRLIPQDDSFTGSKRWLLEIEVDAFVRSMIHKGSCKILMLANWRNNYPALEQGTRLSTLFASATPVDYSDGLPVPALTADDKIALFGICQYDDVNLRPNSRVVFDEYLHLLRALAKIEVYNDEASTDLIESVSITRHTTKAMPMPKGVTHQSHYVKGNYDEDYGPGPSLPSATELTEETEPAAFGKDPATGNFIIYVPEYRNIFNGEKRDDDKRARIKVKYRDKMVEYIDFAYYKTTVAADGSGSYSTVDTSKGTDGHFDILRNYWYKYKLKRNQSRVTWTVDVVPYAERYLDPGFGLDYDDGNP